MSSSNEYKIESFFDAAAVNWDQNNLDSCGADKICDIFKSYINGKDILDIGCGTGVLYEYLKKQNAKSIKAIDMSAEMIKSAKQKYTSGDFEQANIYKWECNQKFNTIIMYNVYPHLMDKENLVKKCCELLKDKGIVIVAHGASKEKINSHHKAHAMGVSEKLKSAKEESLAWTKKFKIKDSYDENDLYYFCLEKL